MAYYRQQHIRPKIKNINRKSPFKRPGFWLLFLFVTLSAILAYCVLFFPKFQINKVNILGYEKLDNQIIEEMIWQKSHNTIEMGIMRFSSKSIFLANVREMAQEIKDSFPLVKKVDIKKEMPNTINLTIEERHQAASLCRGDKCFSIDESGVVFSPQENTPQGGIILIEDGGDEIYLGRVAVPAKTMDAILKIDDILTNNLRIGIRHFTISNPLVVETLEGWKIYFDSTKNTDLQIEEMNSLLEGEITPSERKNLQYIYLQFEDRAYYK